MQETLTLEKLSELPQHHIFAMGDTVDSPTGVNMANTGQALKYVGITGAIRDWAIYVGLASWSFERIAKEGDKVTPRENIKRLVPCDEDAFTRYGY